MFILETDNPAFLNARDYWTEDRLNNRGYYSATEFIGWLREQGGTLDQSARNGNWFVCDDIGVCIAIDTVLFDSAQQATLFLLRWS